jgi:hypothetical protein
MSVALGNSVFHLNEKWDERMVMEVQFHLVAQCLSNIRPKRVRTKNFVRHVEWRQDSVLFVDLCTIL